MFASKYYSWVQQGGSESFRRGKRKGEHSGRIKELSMSKHYAAHKNRKHMLLEDHAQRIQDMDQSFCGEDKDTTVDTIKLKFSWKETLWWATGVSAVTEGMPLRKCICEWGHCVNTGRDPDSSLPSPLTFNQSAEPSEYTYHLTASCHLHC